MVKTHVTESNAREKIQKGALVQTDIVLPPFSLSYKKQRVASLAASSHGSG
jgi:hypothetical protein